MELISVIIPSYNAEKYIEQALKSVLNQTYNKFEVIIVDDGSTDNTFQRLKAYLENGNVRYVRHKKNKGVAAALNTGIRNSRGALVSQLGADDLMLPENLRRKSLFLEKNPDIAMVFSDVYLTDMSKNILKVFPRDTYKASFGRETGIFRQLILEGNFIPACSVIVRKNILDEVGYFDEKLRYGEDFELNLKIANKYKIGYLSEALCLYRQNPNGLVAKSFDPKKYIRNRLYILRRLWAMDLTKDLETAFIGNAHASVGNRYCNLGCYKEAARFYMKAFAKGHPIQLARKYHRKMLKTLFGLAGSPVSDLWKSRRLVL